MCENQWVTYWKQAQILAQNSCNQIFKSPLSGISLHKSDSFSNSISYFLLRHFARFPMSLSWLGVNYVLFWAIPGHQTCVCARGSWMGGGFRCLDIRCNHSTNNSSQRNSESIWKIKHSLICVCRRRLWMEVNCLGEGYLLDTHSHWFSSNKNTFVYTDRNNIFYWTFVS